MLLSAALLSCAFGVAPATMDAIVKVESGGQPLALHVNKWAGLQPKAKTVAEAIQEAQRFMNMGLSVDIGLAQLNSRNLGRLGLTLEQALDPCRNLAAGARVLAGFYAQAVPLWGEGQRALQSALSGYNTGDLAKGFENGYVARYYINVLPPSKIPAKAKSVTVTFNTAVYDRPGYSLEVH